MEATAEIAEIFKGTVKADRSTLEVGDSVFDVWGGEHKVAKVQRFKAHTTAKRDDGQVFVLAGDETMTVRKGA